MTSYHINKTFSIQTHREKEEIYQKERIGTVTNCFFFVVCLFGVVDWFMKFFFQQKKKIHNYPKQPKQKTMV